MLKKSSGSLGIIFIILGLAVLAQTAAGVDTKDTRLFTQPAISPSQIAFVYANNLWVADTDGRNPRQITTDVGVETGPAFSPDGKWIAFSAQYEGNMDVYIVSAAGGVPKRLTWHPGVDIAQGFAPDGTSVYFVSIRSMATPGTGKLYRVSVEGGFPEEFKIPSIRRAALSPDGQYI
ncbi:MAG: peptidase, partial [Candidatus Aminicenantes bacterium]|nr:peptidase [Candidatus Aminicenantes bacterium]